MAPIFKLLALLNLSLCVAARGTQFITGVCTSDAQCASACCGFTSGKCAAPFVANERGEGCGFGDASPNNNALNGIANADGQGSGQTTATASAAPAQTPAAGAAAAGTQFITGVCTSDAQCASACCGFTSGKCAAPLVAKERGEGCGFGDASPNNNTLNGIPNAGGQGSGQATSIAPAAPAQTPAAGTSAAGTQFITGPCSSDADCAAGCCGFKSGKCAGAVVAQERDGGCGFGDAQPNDNAAKALQGRSLGRRGPAYM